MAVNFPDSASTRDEHEQRHEGQVDEVHTLDQTDDQEHRGVQATGGLGLTGHTVDDRGAGQTVTEANLSVGDRITQVAIGATSAVGSTVGAIVSAPIAIVDPETRRGYGSQVRGIGDNLSSGTEAAVGQ